MATQPHPSPMPSASMVRPRCHLYGNRTLKKRGAKNSKGESGMKMETLQNAEAWAVETFGAAELGDVRRTDRLVKIAWALGEVRATHPYGSHRASGSSLPLRSRQSGDVAALARFPRLPAGRPQ